MLKEGKADFDLKIVYWILFASKPKKPNIILKIMLIRFRIIFAYK